MSWLQTSWSYFQTGLGIGAKAESGEVLLVRIQKELRATVSREKDIERKLAEEEISLKKVTAERQELTLRIANLDDNRVFLVKECNANETKLADLELHRNRLAAEKGSLTERWKALERTIHKHESTVKGAAELKKATLIKIPKLEESYRREMSQIEELSAKKRQLAKRISAMSGQRDSAELELRDAQTTHSTLLQLLSDLKDADAKDSSAAVRSVEDRSQVRERVRSSQNCCSEVHAKVRRFEVDLESLQTEMGALLLAIMASEKKSTRVKDMIQLQQLTLGSLEESKADSSTALKSEYSEKSQIKSKLTQVATVLRECESTIQLLTDEIFALKDALQKLSNKKTEFSVKLKKAMKLERSLKESLKSLRKNRLAIRLKKEELAVEKVKLEEQESAVRSFTSSTAAVLRMDNPAHGRGQRGALTVTQTQLVFEPMDSLSADGALRHSLSEISHSVWNSGRKKAAAHCGLFEVYLKHGVSYIRPKKKGESIISAAYNFQAADSDENKHLFAMNAFLTVRRSFGPLTTDGKSEEKSSAVGSAAVGRRRMSYGLVPRDVVLCKSSPLSGICDLFEMKQLILHCPSRTHMFEWRMYYSALRDGSSIGTFYESVGGYAKTGNDLDESLLVVKSVSGARFGAFLDTKWQVCGDYRGSIDSFVFCFRSDGALAVFKSAGCHSYYIRSTTDSITIGAGECPALYLDADLHYGRSMKCRTFGSPLLSRDNHFEVNEIEVWGPKYD